MFRKVLLFIFSWFYIRKVIFKSIESDYNSLRINKFLCKVNKLFGQSHTFFESFTILWLAQFICLSISCWWCLLGLISLWRNAIFCLDDVLIVFYETKVITFLKKWRLLEFLKLNLFVWVPTLLTYFVFNII